MPILGFNTEEAMQRRPIAPPEIIDPEYFETHGYPPGLPSMVKIPQAWARDKATKLGWKKKH